MRKFFALLIAGALAFTAFGCHDHHHHHHDRKHTNPPVVTRPAPPRPAELGRRPRAAAASLIQMNIHKAPPSSGAFVLRVYSSRQTEKSRLVLKKHRLIFPAFILYFIYVIFIRFSNNSYFKAISIT